MAHDQVEFWTFGHATPGKFVGQAIHAEEDGWDGIVAGESQNITGDPFVELGIAATRTSRIGLGTGVAITATRHPATTATAIASVQIESGGRAVLGIGTGDSATAWLGLAPAPVGVFAHYLERLQAYLRGDEVPFDVEADSHGGRYRSSKAMGLADGPTSSRLRWLPRNVPKVPVDVGATGPKTIAAAARIADRVSFAVGADPERVRWAVDIARGARQDAGLSADMPLGAYLPVFVHPDRAKARQLISGTAASVAHMSSMLGTVSGPADEQRSRVLMAVHDSYDMNTHQTSDSPHSRVLTDEVADAFSIAGPANYCAERLLELAELGLSKIVMLGYSWDMDADEARASRQRLIQEVIPAVRAGTRR